MTAVEWLVIEIDYQKCWADPIRLKHLIKQAKEMEKQQIIDAYYEGKEYGFKEQGEQYYNETYKKTYTEDISPDWKGDPNHLNRWDGW